MYDRVCSTCGRRYGQHIGEFRSGQNMDKPHRETFAYSGHDRSEKHKTTLPKTRDDYEIICKICGRRRGNHYSTSKYGHTLIFYTHDDFQRYLDTSIIQGKRFVPDDTNEKYNYKPEIIKDAMVVMAATDSWAKKGQIGIIRRREDNSAQVSWLDGGVYYHSLSSISLLKEAKDPNILFLIKKINDISMAARRRQS